MPTDELSRLQKRAAIKSRDWLMAESTSSVVQSGTTFLKDSLTWKPRYFRNYSITGCMGASNTECSSTSVRRRTMHELNSYCGFFDPRVYLPSVFRAVSIGTTDRGIFELECEEEMTGLSDFEECESRSIRASIATKELLLK